MPNMRRSQTLSAMFLQIVSRQEASRIGGGLRSLVMRFEVNARQLSKSKSKIGSAVIYPRVQT